MNDSAVVPTTAATTLRQGSGFRVQGAGCRVQGAGCRVQDSRFRVENSGFMYDSAVVPTTAATTLRPAIPQSAIKTPSSGSRFLPALTGIWRRVVQIKVIEKTICSSSEGWWLTGWGLQGYLAHMKQPPCRTLQ